MHAHGHLKAETGTLTISNRSVSSLFTLYCISCGDLGLAQTIGPSRVQLLGCPTHRTYPAVSMRQKEYSLFALARRGLKFSTPPPLEPLVSNYFCTLEHFRLKRSKMSNPAANNGDVHDAEGAAKFHGMDPAEYAKLQAAEDRLATAEEAPPPAQNPIKRWVIITVSGSARTCASPPTLTAASETLRGLQVACKETQKFILTFLCCWVPLLRVPAVETLLTQRTVNPWHRIRLTRNATALLFPHS